MLFICSLVQVRCISCFLRSFSKKIRNFALLLYANIQNRAFFALIFHYIFASKVRLQPRYKKTIESEYLFTIKEL